MGWKVMVDWVCSNLAATRQVIEQEFSLKGVENQCYNLTHDRHFDVTNRVVDVLEIIETFPVQTGVDAMIGAVRFGNAVWYSVGLVPVIS